MVGLYFMLWKSYYKAQHCAVCWRKVTYVEYLKSACLFYIIVTIGLIEGAANLLCRILIAWRHLTMWPCDHHTYIWNVSVAVRICKNCCGCFPRHSKWQTAQQLAYGWHWDFATHAIKCANSHNDSGNGYIGHYFGNQMRHFGLRGINHIFQNGDWDICIFMTHSISCYRTLPTRVLPTRTIPTRTVPT